ncbi:Peptidase S9 [Macleaya cordata]|uniref:Prolyl endopeptidase n=1 Tax=Macleaya cordata TaxID=56857 RepID=A0A200QJC9_MACCD|nr:Peptidase S9 [Macleaya cordata]
MPNLLTVTLQKQRIHNLLNTVSYLRFAHWKAAPPPRPQKPPPPPTPPKPPQKPVSFTFHEETWQDPYSWMSNLSDKVAMRHMDVYMEQEEKYTEAVMSETDRLQRKLQSEMAIRMTSDLSTPPVRWGPWLYYRRVEEGKQYPVLCRRSVNLNEEFISYSSPAAGFDFTAGKRIEQKLLDYNQEAERFGGYAYEELSEVSPDHRFLAYTMYDKDNDFFRLSVRDLSSGSLCKKPEADRVANLAWGKDGKTLLYTVTDSNKRPYRIFCSMVGSNEDDVLLVEESDENIYLNIRHTKDFQFVSVNVFSNTFSKVYLINAADPLSGMKLVYECEPHAHCIVEHHRGYLYLFTDAAKEGQPVDFHYLLCCPVEVSESRNWETIFLDESDFVIEDVDFNDTHLVLILREGQKFKICSIPLPLPNRKGAVALKELNPSFLPLPKYVAQISPGPNYDYYSSTMRFTISSPVMPDAVVDYDLTNGKWFIVQQQNVLHEGTRTLYGVTSSSAANIEKPLRSKNLCLTNEVNSEDDHSWNDLSEFYACEHYDVSSHDDVVVPLTIVYSRKYKQDGQNPGLLHGHGAYGELLDKRWRSELKSLLDRGWVVAYADVRGGGGRGKKWHHDGRRTKKQNSIEDYISCAKFLVEKEIVQQNKLAAWGYSAGGLLVASAINMHPDLFRAAVLKVPFLDACNTLLYPILPLTPADYEEFGYPGDVDDFQAIRKYSPYDNIQKDALYPAVLVTSSFNTRFGVWEAAKWVARVREHAIYDPQRPILLNLTTDIVEENRYLQCKESALETAFLIKMMDS